MRRLNDSVLSARNRGSPRAMPASIAHSAHHGRAGRAWRRADRGGRDRRRRGALGGRERTVDDGANAVISNRACSSMIEAFVSSSGIAGLRSM